MRLPEISLPRRLIWQKLLLPEFTFPQKLIFQNLHLPVFTFGQNYISSKTYIHEIMHSHPKISLLIEPTLQKYISKLF